LSAQPGYLTYLVLQQLKTHLTQAMQTEIAKSDPTRVSMVKIGRFQSDPTQNAIYLSISGGSQTDPDLMDGIVSLTEFERIAVYVPAREFGGRGTQAWWRRGEVKIGVFLLTGHKVEETAANVAYTVLGRLQANIENLEVGGIRDQFGELARKIYCFSSSFMESGGPPDQYIWRGSVKWQVLTVREGV
jgi:hypothetical protein